MRELLVIFGWAPESVLVFPLVPLFPELLLGAESVLPVSVLLGLVLMTASGFSVELDGPVST